MRILDSIFGELGIPNLGGAIAGDYVSCDSLMTKITQTESRDKLV